METFEDCETFSNCYFWRAALRNWIYSLQFYFLFNAISDRRFMALKRLKNQIYYAKLLAKSFDTFVCASGKNCQNWYSQDKQRFYCWKTRYRATWSINEWKLSSMRNLTFLVRYSFITLKNITSRMSELLL